MTVVPQLAFFIFVFATIFSLVASHLLLAIQRYVDRRHAKIFIAESYPLCKQPFFLGDRVVIVSKFGIVVITVLLVFSFVAIFAGSFIHSFTFHFHGLVGFILKERSVSKFSMITVAQTIPLNLGPSHFFAAIFIPVVFYTFALIVPLLHLLCLLVLWLVPMRVALQEYLFIFSEVLNAWSAIDVFVFSLIVALLEIEPFAQFLVGDKCTLVNKILKEFFGSVLGNDTVCFRVTASLDAGCWFLFFAVLVYMLVRLSVSFICALAIDYVYEVEGKLPKSLSSGLYSCLSTIRLIRDGEKR